MVVTRHLCAATLIALAGGTSPAAAASAPVALTACRLESVLLSTSSPYANVQPSTTNLYYRFVDTTPQPVRIVEVDVRYDGQTRHFIDKGTFRPGVAVERNFDGHRHGPQGPLMCRISRVVLLDGTAWTAEPNPQLDAAQ